MRVINTEEIGQQLVKFVSRDSKTRKFGPWQKTTVQSSTTRQIWFQSIPCKKTLSCCMKLHAVSFSREMQLTVTYNKNLSVSKDPVWIGMTRVDLLGWQWIDKSPVS